MTERKTLAQIKGERQFQNEPVVASEHHAEPNEANRRLLFEVWEIASRIVDELEEIRDANQPKGDEEWNSDFCKAIQILPEAREFEQKCWWIYHDYGKD